MIDKMTFRAIYENGVIKPLVPLNLSEQETLEVQITVQSKERKVVDLEGIWAKYAPEGGISFEEIDDLTRKQHEKALERLLRQVEGDFSEDESVDQ